MDGSEAGGGGASWRERGGRTDWCVMSMLSGPLRTTRFPPRPAILLSRDWAQVRVTCGRASSAACDGTCSCTKLGGAIAACETRAEWREHAKRREIIHRIFCPISPFFISSPPLAPLPAHNGPRRLPRGPPARGPPLPPHSALPPLLVPLPRPQLRRPLRQGTRLVRRDQQRRAFRRPVPRLPLDDYRRTP